MDTTTLLVANGLLFALYAGVMLINARIGGGARGATWFAGSSLMRGAAMLLVGVWWLQIVPSRYVEALSAVCAVAGALMLYQAFAELLERGRLLNGEQVGLAVVMVAGVAVVLLDSRLQGLLIPLVSGVLGVQFAVVAVLVFRYSGEGVRPVGWLTGLGLAVYSLAMMLRAVMLAGLGTSLSGVAWINPLWLTACLVTSAITAFGFKAISTEQQRVELVWRAQLDELTGLLNRWALKRLVMREIERCKRRKCSLAVVMIDLDGLKRVNDTAGHSCGDVVLQAVAGVLQETVRDQDVVARMGGDEFCVLLPETSLDEALHVAERLRAEIEDLVVKYRGETVRTVASLGVTSSDITGLTWQGLMDASDSALYGAKRQGRNRVVVAGKDDGAVPFPRKPPVSVTERRPGQLSEETGS